MAAHLAALLLLLPDSVPGGVRVLVLLHPHLLLGHALEEVRPSGPEGPGGLAQLTDPESGGGQFVYQVNTRRYVCTEVRFLTVHRAE